LNSSVLVFRENKGNQQKREKNRLNFWHSKWISDRWIIKWIDQISNHLTEVVLSERWSY
jgi:hypothetical protein